MINLKPTNGFMKSSVSRDWLMVGLGVLFVISISVTLGLKTFEMITAGKTNRLILMLTFLGFGGGMLALGTWNLTQRKRYLAMKEKYWEEVRADDLVEALHFTSKWRSGMEIAEELYTPKKDVRFGLVWLAGQCGNRQFADCYRVLSRMEDAEIVLHHMRLAENRVKRMALTLGLWYIPYFVLNNGGKWIAQFVWRDPVEAAAKKWIVDAVLFTSISIWGGIMVWRQYRLGPEEGECVPYLKGLPDTELSILVGRGRLGRIARSVLNSRATSLRADG